jgi:hypothetical protein
VGEEHLGPRSRNVDAPHSSSSDSIELINDTLIHNSLWINSPPAPINKSLIISPPGVPFMVSHPNTTFLNPWVGSASASWISDGSNGSQNDPIFQMTVSLLFCCQPPTTVW